MTLQTSDAPNASFLELWHRNTQQTTGNWSRITIVKVSSRYLLPFCRNRRGTLKKLDFFRKFDLWPVISRSNVDQAPKIYHQSRDLVKSNPLVFSAKLYDAPLSNARGVAQPPLHGRRWQNTVYGRGLNIQHRGVKNYYYFCRNKVAQEQVTLFWRK